ncbi:troponin I4a [Garra rufa]|uniref:troponin I4a n=1 Tax=Garra rufa TaxID=137080 RepID=UPI003CCE7E70
MLSASKFIPQHHFPQKNPINPLLTEFNETVKKKAKSKYSATRRLLLKSKLLKKAENLLVKEKEQKDLERENILRERAPPLNLSGLSVQELQELCKDLHQKIDIVDEARYDLNIKVNRNDQEILSLTQKVYELKGKMKRPNLRRVKKSAGAMLGALTDSRVMKADFKANLKTVKKEEEKKEEVTDWRKNVEAMSGMEGRKKLFNAGQ